MAFVRQDGSLYYYELLILGRNRGDVAKFSQRFIGPSDVRVLPLGLQAKRCLRGVRIEFRLGRLGATVSTGTKWIMIYSF